MQGAGLARLDVEMRLQGDADGETEMRLPRQWAGEDGLWRNLRDVRVEGAASVREPEPAVRIVSHAPRAPLTLRYAVVDPREAEPGTQFSKATPVVRPGWFFFHGEGVFAEPSDSEGRPARFAWGPMPPGWRAASDLDHLGPRAGAVGDVIESVALGGPDLTVVTQDVGGAPMRVAIRGQGWRFPVQAFGEMTARIFVAEAAFWGDRGRPYTVVVAPLQVTNPSNRSSYGTGRTDAFSVAATLNVELSQQPFFLAHELLHTWNARELGGLAAGDEALGYWFSEGFTDFYAARLLLRSGVGSLEEFVAAQNRLLRQYAASPARTATNAEILQGFWKERALEQLPYQRGALLAAVIDHRLRSRSSIRMSLDDVMLEQRRRAAANDRAGVKLPAAALFPVVMREYARWDVSELLTRHVERGEPIELPRDLYAPCARIDTVTQEEGGRTLTVQEVTLTEALQPQRREACARMMTGQ
jgi:predicted metalloprotease with PDZ domain